MTTLDEKQLAGIDDLINELRLRAQTAEAEVERLTRELAECNSDFARIAPDADIRIFRAERRAESAEAALAEARGDADRLQFLIDTAEFPSNGAGRDREAWLCIGSKIEWPGGVRAAIDAAIAAKGEGK